MLTRRHFLQTCGEVSMLLAGTAALTGPVIATVPNRKFEVGKQQQVAVYDGRLPDMVAFSSEAKRFGSTLCQIDGDISELWQDLNSQWTQNLFNIYGLTREADFFLLKQLALEKGLRMSYRGEHTYLENGHLQHVLTGPMGMEEEDIVAQLERAGSNWGHVIAHSAVRACKSRTLSEATYTCTVTCRRQVRIPDRQVSWAFTAI